MTGPTRFTSRHFEVVARRRNRPRYILLVLVLASATAITIGYRGQTNGAVSGLKRVAHDVFSPIDSAVSSALRPVGNFFEGAFHYGDLQDQNARLLQENARLRTRSLQAQGAQRQVEQLRRQLNVPGNFPAVTAEVTSNSSSNFSATVQLDKGQSSGIEDGMPVVSGGALVGRVVESWHSGCTVLLITDPTSSVGVRYGSAPAAEAVLSGQGVGQPLRVDDALPQTTVRVGEPMDTSGLQNAVFPPDIPVGTVKSARLRPSSPQWDATLSPVIDLTRLEFVTVLEWTPQG